MRVVFMGTTDFAVKSLDKLVAMGADVLACVTQPDRPKGRKKILTPPPVKVYALEHNIPVLQPEKISSPEAFEDLKALGNLDFIAVAAYGQKVPKSVLDMPRYGCVNVHGSLLPRHRGAAPMQYTLLCGDKVGGVTTMMMAEGLDTGDMLLKAQIDIDDNDTAGTLTPKLAALGADLLEKTLMGMMNGEITPIPQDDSAATVARSLKSDAGFIDFAKSAQETLNIYRGTTPAPGAYTLTEGRRLKIIAAEKADAQGEPGTVFDVTKKGIVVCCGEGGVLLKELQPEGKKPMTAADYARGKRIVKGDTLR